MIEKLGRILLFEIIFIPCQFLYFTWQEHYFNRSALLLLAAKMQNHHLLFKHRDVDNKLIDKKRHSQTLFRLYRLLLRFLICVFKLN